MKTIKLDNRFPKSFLTQCNAHIEFGRTKLEEVHDTITSNLNNMLIIEAVFIGKNGSLGFITGKIYTLKVTGNLIVDVDENIICRYSTLTGFIKNWKIIKTNVWPK